MNCYFYVKVVLVKGLTLAYPYIFLMDISVICDTVILMLTNSHLTHYVGRFREVVVAQRGDHLAAGLVPL